MKYKNNKKGRRVQEKGKYEKREERKEEGP